MLIMMGRFVVNPGGGVERRKEGERVLLVDFLGLERKGRSGCGDVWMHGDV